MTCSGPAMVPGRFGSGGAGMRRRDIWKNRTTDRGRSMPVLVAALGGAGLAYLLDPDTGKRRRIIARDRSMSLARRGWRRLSRFSRYLSAELWGIRQKAIHQPPWEQTASAFRGEAQPKAA
jgi:hypothetical protein